MSGDPSRRLCDYCGLPAPGRVDEAAPDEPVYCCFGCRFAASITAAGGDEGQSRWLLTRLGLAIFFTMNVMVFSMALWTLAAPGAEAADAASQTLADLFRLLCLVFSAPVLVLLGGPLVEDAILAARRGEINAAMLLALGTIAAWLYSAASVALGRGHVYFEVACVVLVMAILGRWLEAAGRHRATQALQSLQALLPATVRRIHLQDGHAQEEAAPLESVQAGDLVRVLPGERVPVDGEIMHGKGAVDEQILTGESRPLVKGPGETMLAGALSLDGDLLLRAASPPGEGALQRLVALVQAATQEKSRWEQTADRLAAWFVPGVACLAALAFAWRLGRGELEEAILSALAVTLIACPCALGVATPLALWAAIARGARQGVLFRNGDAVSRAAAARVVCFDKTGTLTTGDVAVAAIVLDPQAPPAPTLAAAAALAGASTHPYSAAIRRRLGGDRAALPSEVQMIAGRGVKGRLGKCGPQGALGSERLLREEGCVIDPALWEQAQRQGAASQPVVWLALDGRAAGVFLLAEQPRPEARPALSQLSASGLILTMLTGDHADRASELSRLFGIEARAGLLPDAKLAALRELRAKHGPVMMVGDGCNDAPALAAADAGVALGCGADVAREAADVCLLGNDLAKIPWAIDLARSAARTVRQNLFWAFAYNVAGIGLALAGWLNPIWAAVAMVGSSLFVITNSLRLASDPPAAAAGQAQDAELWRIPERAPLPRQGVAEGAGS